MHTRLAQSSVFSLLKIDRTTYTWPHVWLMFRASLPLGLLVYKERRFPKHSRRKHDLNNRDPMGAGQFPNGASWLHSFSNNTGPRPSKHLAVEYPIGHLHGNRIPVKIDVGKQTRHGALHFKTHVIRTEAHRISPSVKHT